MYGRSSFSSNFNFWCTCCVYFQRRLSIATAILLHGHKKSYKRKGRHEQRLFAPTFALALPYITSHPKDRSRKETVGNLAVAVGKNRIISRGLSCVACCNAKFAAPMACIQGWKTTSLRNELNQPPATSNKIVICFQCSANRQRALLSYPSIFPSFLSSHHIQYVSSFSDN